MNRHVILALVIAPALSFLGWWAAGALVGERPQSVQPGQSYPLVATSSCRWASGECQLENADMTLAFRAERSGTALLQLQTSLPVDGVLIALGGRADTTPVPAQASPPSQRSVWHLALPRWPGPGEEIRVVVLAAGATWYGETSSAFLQPAN